MNDQASGPAPVAAPHDTFVSGVGFCEGPTLLRSGNLAVVAIDRGALYEIADGGARLVCETEAGANGATEGADGRIYVAHFWNAWPAKDALRSTGGVLACTLDGTLEWLTRDPVSPNDLCFGPDEALYVTDPTRPGRHDGRLWRVDPDSGQAELLRSLDWYPNGIGFDPDDRLWVADTLGQRLLRFPFAGGQLGDPEVVVRMPHGHPDGFAFDVDGNVVVAAVSRSGPGDLQVYSGEGTLHEIMALGDSLYYTNVALSADATLYVTDSDGGRVLAVDGYQAQGLPLHPFR